MPNELKTEDVMRALECHSGDGDCFKVCHYFTNVYDESCIKNLVCDALALLREKDASIEMMVECIGRQDKELAKKDAEIERLKALVEEIYSLNNELIDDVDKLKAERADVMYFKDQIRAEAITEFVESAKKKAYTGGILKPYVKLEDLEKIAKEMRNNRNGESDL